MGDAAPMLEICGLHARAGDAEILKGLGFEGALHATLDDGHFPEGTQSKIDWEGIDGTSILRWPTCRHLVKRRER